MSTSTPLSGRAGSPVERSVHVVPPSSERQTRAPPIDVDVAQIRLVFEGRQFRSLIQAPTRGVASANLLSPDRSGFSGALPLAPGANDVELAVESDRGTAALFRFRVYAAPDRLERFLAELRERNRALELRARALDGETRDVLAERRSRRLEVEALPANEAIIAP